MKACGIVAEYNPFHNGHGRLIQLAKEACPCDCVIAVMSGNFVQRGEPAVIDKVTRAASAVRNGIDLVIELPYIYATQGANAFCHGAVSLLKIAKVEAIAFGSECGNMENLKDIAETRVNIEHLRALLDTGMSYPKAYSLLTSSMCPNDLLAVNYLREIEGTAIQPVIIQRNNDYHGEEIDSICSATAIRKALSQGRDLGNSTPMEEELKNGTLVTMEEFYPYLRTFLCTVSPERLREFFLYSEGIEYLLIKNAKEYSDYSSFLHACITPRYTASRIRRILLQTMVQVTKEEVQKLPPLDTLRVLAFNDTGRAYLHTLRKEGKVAGRFAKVPFPYRTLEYRSTLLYTSFMSEEKRRDLLSKEIGGALYIH